jgi:hypothetical protein
MSICFVKPLDDKHAVFIGVLERWPALARRMYAYSESSIISNS